MYDENDGFFDHVSRRSPSRARRTSSPTASRSGSAAGCRCGPISPWSRGGWVNSQVFDHTSVLRFLERVTGVREPNISDWRRAVCGDLTSCFDFTNPTTASRGCPTRWR